MEEKCARTILLLSLTNWLVTSHRNRAFEILASNKHLFAFKRLGMRSVLPQQKHIHQTESNLCECYRLNQQIQ